LVERRKDLNILFATAQPYIQQMFGGLQTSTDELASHLAGAGRGVSVLCALMGSGTLGFVGRLKMKIFSQKAACDTRLGYPVWRAWFPWEMMEWVLRQIKPDVVVILARQPVRMAMTVRRANIPILLVLQDVEFGDHGGEFNEIGEVPCVANSAFTADKYRQAFGVDPVVIPPLIDGAPLYRTETTKENITFINPHLFKGVDIALAVARRCPEIPFAFVETWPLPKSNRAELKSELAGLRNVSLLPVERDMKDLREVPHSPGSKPLGGRLRSRSMGAQYSGIPVIASDRGGLPEAVGAGGVLVDPDGPLDAWVAATQRLWRDKEYYSKLAGAAYAHSNRPALRWDVQLPLWEKAFADAIHGVPRAGENKVA